MGGNYLFAIGEGYTSIFPVPTIHSFIFHRRYYPFEVGYST